MALFLSSSNPITAGRTIVQYVGQYMTAINNIITYNAASETYIVAMIAMTTSDVRLKYSCTGLHKEAVHYNIRKFF